MLENMLLNDCFDTAVRTNTLKFFGHGKPGKVMKRSWNFRIINEYEP